MATHSGNPLAADLDSILERTCDLWEDLRDDRIFMTGATGFFGCWLLESFAWANSRLSLGAQAVVLSRDPEAFRRKAPHLAADSSICLHAGDVRSFQFPDGSFPFFIHAATEASARLIQEEPGRMLSTIVDGTRRTLEFSALAHARRLLLTSSGAVYGTQPPAITHVSEEHPGAPSPCHSGSVYGEGKRLAELMCAVEAAGGSLQCPIARCFAFVGPHLPLDTHFAIGNFIKDTLAGGPIRVHGDGTPYRSYLYAADLMAWLWTILFRGQSCRPYNVGSEHDLSIADVAREVAATVNPPVPVHVAQRPTLDASPLRYVPSTLRARSELGLTETVSLQDAIRRTVHWHNSSLVGAS